MASAPHKTSKRRFKGFQRTSTLLETRIRDAGAARGFAVTRLLTHWAEIVGPEASKVCRPVKVGYSKGGFGATLTVLTTSAQAPMLEMQLPQIRERVNACYGYSAISRIRLTQTAPTGFAEGQAVFEPPAAPAAKPAPAPELCAQAAKVAAPVEDEGLRAALSQLGANILAKSK